MNRPLDCTEIAAPSVAAALSQWNVQAANWGLTEDDLVSVSALPAPAPYPIQFVDGDATQPDQVRVVFVYRRNRR